MINSYPNVLAIGHRMIKDIFSGEVLIEEKVDGSQFSFGIIDGELMCRSKGRQQILDAPDSLFEKAVEIIRGLDCHPGWFYRGEYLAKPKHNALAYSRIPEKNIILFDIQTGIETYMTPEEKKAEAERIGLECVPVMFQGMVTDFEMFKGFLDRESILGGVKVEGVVVKNYNLFTQEKKVAMGKYVSENFKETHSEEWRKANPGKSDLIGLLIERYKTTARWAKAVQHLREVGKIVGVPQDIGLLIKEVPADVRKECEDEIKESLFKHFWPHIQRGITKGLPEWYKDELAKTSFME